MSEYETEYFHYSRKNFEYKLEIKDYEFEVNDKTKLIKDTCLLLYSRIPKIFDPFFPVYNLPFILSNNTEDLYIKIIDVLPINYFTEELPDIIYNLVNPDGVWAYDSTNPAGRIPGMGYSPVYRALNTKKNNVYKDCGFLPIYTHKFHGTGPCGDILNGDNRINYLDDICKNGKGGKKVNNSDVMKHVALEYILNIPEVEIINNEGIENRLFEIYYKYNGEIGIYNDAGCQNIFKLLDLELLKIPNVLSLEQVKSHTGSIGKIKYIISEMYDLKACDYYFYDDYLIPTKIQLYLYDVTRDLELDYEFTAENIVTEFQKCLMTLYSIKTSQSIKEKIELLAYSPPFGTVESVQYYIDIGPLNRGKEYAEILKSDIFLGIEECLSVIECYLPAYEEDVGTVSKNIDVTYSNETGLKINDFDLRFAAKIKDVPDSWNKYTPYMTCSLMIPTFEKNRKLKDLKRMKLKDIYKQYNKEDNINIKNHKTYIDKLKIHLKSLGYETKDFVALNYEQIKKLKPKEVTEVTIIDEEYIIGLIEKILDKWIKFLPDYKTNIKDSLSIFFLENKIELKNIDFDNNINMEIIDYFVSNYTNYLERTSFFNPKNIYNLIKNICKYSSNEYLNSYQVIESFYAQTHTTNVYSANFEILTHLRLVNKANIKVIQTFDSHLIKFMTKNLFLEFLSDVSKDITKKELILADYGVYSK